MYVGRKVRLREFRTSDLEKDLEYINDLEIRTFFEPDVWYPYTEIDESKWFENLSSNRNRCSFAIETLEEKKFIGACGIMNINWKNRLAEFKIYIGDKDYWGKGYGTDTVKLLIGVMFEEMNLNKIKLKVFSFNKRAIKTYEKCGFTREGLLRSEVFKGGQYYDYVVMGLLRDEYRRL